MRRRKRCATTRVAIQADGEVTTAMLRFMCKRRGCDERVACPRLIHTSKAHCHLHQTSFPLKFISVDLSFEIITLKLVSRDKNTLLKINNYFKRK